MALHVPPCAVFGTQVVPLHHAVETQSPSVAQVALHAVAPHRYGEQFTLVVARQAPAPLQTNALACVEPLHAWGAHSLSGSAPSAMVPHAPSAPLPFFTAEHAWHAPAHAASQQTPSTQKPETQSLESAHASPLPCAYAKA